jgi:hypothetical protein
VIAAGHGLAGPAADQLFLDRMRRGEITAGSIEYLEQVRLAETAGAAIVITQPVRFGRDLDSDLRHLQWLRDATSHAIRLTWTLNGEPLLDHRDYSHLVPPSASAAPGSVAEVARWREEFSYGTFYYRVGPGFVTVKDVRPGGEHARMTISGTDAERFIQLARSSQRHADDALLEAALEALADAGLARYSKTAQAVLPFRIRHWPVPFLAI